MLIKELLQLKELDENIKDFSDPDRAPGAIEREANARQAAAERSSIAVDNLNELIRDYSLGSTVKISDRWDDRGQIIHDHENKSQTSEKVRGYLLGRDDYVVSFANVENAEEEAKMIEMRLRTEARGHYGLYSYSNDDAVIIKFGPAYRYYDESLVKVFRHIMDYALKHIK